MDLTAYDVPLKRNDTFVLYLRDGIATRQTDEENPYPCTVSKWCKATNDFSRVGLGPDKVVFPTYAIAKEDINAFWDEHIPMELDFLLTNEAVLDGEAGPKNALYILHKEWDDVFEVGFGVWLGRGTHIHEYIQHMIDQYMKLKAFW
jgi:hypothetical protein